MLHFRLGLDFIVDQHGNFHVIEVNGIHSGTVHWGLRKNLEFHKDELARICSYASGKAILVQEANPLMSHNEYITDAGVFCLEWPGIETIARQNGLPVYVFNKIGVFDGNKILIDYSQFGVNECVIIDPSDIGVLVYEGSYEQSAVENILGFDRLINPFLIEALTWDKVLSGTMLKGTAIATMVPDFLWTYGPPDARDVFTAFEKLRAEKIVVKPAGGCRGTSIYIFDISDPGIERRCNEMVGVAGPAEIRSRIVSNGKWVVQPFISSKQYVVQKYVAGHPTIAQHLGCYRVLCHGPVGLEGYLRLSRTPATEIDISDDSRIVNGARGAIPNEIPEDTRDAIIQAAGDISGAFSEAAVRTNLSELEKRSQAYRL
ncbi:MAG: hypothetical protein ABIG95_07110 [Candidatus Woesearchaeota archaeon]